MPSTRPPWLGRARLRVRTLLLVAALPLTGRAQHSSWQLARLVAAHPDCFLRDAKYHPDIPNTNVKAKSLRHCQALCHRMDGCAKFSYWSDSQDCYFSDDQAERQDSSGAVAGLGVCPEAEGVSSKACTRDMPGNGFPGFTGKASNGAWPAGKQPRSLECWPRNDTGGYMSCKQVTVLEDTELGWPGKCRGLAKLNGSFSQCAEDCKRNPLCPSWQTGASGCWQGLGQDCFVRTDFTPIRAQRVQHGSVRVLMNLTGWQIVGLAKSFDNSHGYFLKQADAIEACRKVCYSDIRCQYWQFAPKYGCWVEDSSQNYHPPWPLTTEWAYRSTPFALDCVAGEYIQHTCPKGMATPFAPAVQERLTSCMVTGYDYDPPDMRWQSTTVEMSAETCQERCKSTMGCMSFTFWPDGTCHLQDEDAVKTVAKDYRVISGPVTCSGRRPKHTTEKPTEAVGTQPRGVSPMLGSGPGPEPAAGQTVTVAEVMVDIKNLPWKYVNDATQERLKDAYIRILARHLGVPKKALRSKPRGPGGDLIVQGSSYGSDVENSAKGALLVVYVVNRPPSSTNVSWIKTKVSSPDFKREILRATRKTAADSRNSTVNTNSIPGIGMFNEHTANVTRDIGIGFTQVHALTGKKKDAMEKGHEKASACGFACHWWPLVVGVLLLLCTAGIGVGALYYGKRARPKKRKRGGAQDSTMSGQSTSRSFSSQSGMTPGGSSMYATNTGQEMQPLVGHFQPQPVNATGREVFGIQQQFARTAEFGTAGLSRPPPHRRHEFEV